MEAAGKHEASEADEAERWEEIAKMRRLMRDHGVKKAPGVEFNHSRWRGHEFVAGDESHPQAEEIFQTWGKLLQILKLKGFVPNTRFCAEQIQMVIQNMVEDEVELGGGDEAILVLIVELKCVMELGGSAIFGATVAEGGELGQGNEAVMVGVELVHDAAELVLVEEGGAEGAEDGIELPM
uniref:Uncharacterized protein n=1 Tax=Quercus lobata TaxID=97700 RepID=A0A7N2LKH4_QUELO